MPHTYRPSRSRQHSISQQAPNTQPPTHSNNPSSANTPDRPRSAATRSPARARQTPTRRQPANPANQSPGPRNTAVNGGHYAPSPKPAAQRVHSGSHRHNVQYAPSPDQAVSKQSQPQATMSPSSRLAWNLKVLQRHDATITSIVHQVSYAVLYMYNFGRLPGENGEPGPLIGWEKVGVEGSMFVYERSGYPSYGFFILNRNGIGNFIQTMSKRDDLEITDNEDYIIWRSPSPPPPPGSDQPRSKGVCVGLWIFEPTARKKLTEFMTKLHAHIKTTPTPSSSRSPSPASVSNSDTFSQDQNNADAIDYSSSPVSSRSSASTRQTPALPTSDVPSESEQSTQSELDTLFSRIRMPGQLVASISGSKDSPNGFGSQTITSSTIPLPTVQQPSSTENAASAADLSDRSTPSHSLHLRGSGSEERGRALLDTLFNPAAAAVFRMGAPDIGDGEDSIVYPQSASRGTPGPSVASASTNVTTSGDGATVLTGDVLHTLLGLLPGAPSSHARVPLPVPELPRTPSPRQQQTSFNPVEMLNDRMEDMDQPLDIPYEPEYALPQSTASVFDTLAPKSKAQYAQGNMGFPTERELVPFEMSPLPPSPSLLPAPSHDWNPPSSNAYQNGGNGNGKRGQGSRQRRRNGNGNGLLPKRAKGKARDGGEDVFGYEGEEVEGGYYLTGVDGVEGCERGSSPYQPRAVRTGGGARGPKEQYIPHNGVGGGGRGRGGKAKVQRGDVMDTLVNGYLGSGKYGGGAEEGDGVEIQRNEFVREILTLIHTDSGFVDELYSVYLEKSRQGQV